MNTGIERSKGNYIAFLDSDDCWIKGKLTEQYLALSKSNKNVIGVVCGHQTIDENESNQIFIIGISLEANKSKKFVKIWMWFGSGRKFSHEKRACP